MAQAESLESRYIRVLEEHLNLLKISGSNAHNPQEALQAPISGVTQIDHTYADESAVNSPSVANAEEDVEEEAESSPIEDRDSLPNQESTSAQAQVNGGAKSPPQSSLDGRVEDLNEVPSERLVAVVTEGVITTGAEPGGTEILEETLIRIVINRWNEDRSTWEDVDDSIVSKQQPSVPEKPATFRRHMDPDNEKKVSYEEVEIISRPLKELVAEIDERWREHDMETTQPLVQQSPFYFFAWCWDNYVEACEPQEQGSTERLHSRKVLKALLDLIRKSRTLETYLRLRDPMLSGKKIRFEYLWTLFSHGSQVYTRSCLNELQMLEVKSCSQPGYINRRFRVSCVCFDWDGSKFSRYTYDFFIKPYAGEKPIASLDVFPAKYYCNSEGVYDDSQLRQSLIERGRKYCDLCIDEQNTFQCRYQGSAVVSASDAPWYHSGRPGTGTLASSADPDHDGGEMDITSLDLTGDQTRVIIDNYSFLKSKRNTANSDNMPPLGRKIAYLEPDCPCPLCKTSKLQQWRTEMRGDQPAEGDARGFAEDEDRLLFLPPRLLGFVLKERSWAQFLVDNITRTNFVETSEQTDPFWKELELREDSKKQLMALVKFHKSLRLQKSGSRDLDVIEGKGHGLAILLHGPPGVGKTLTAETIALATGRPLLNVSVAEIGLKPQEAEKRLSEVFDDATRWDAVLLMDEADVFVEGRGPGDLDRNALVSVLLRCLEYYEGIIILTTNRIKSIDIAVQSRVHLAIQYHELTRKERVGIYLNRIKWIPDDEIEDRKSLEAGVVDSVLTTRSEANGRQIRNILIGARALAKSRDEKLRLKHLEEVDQTTSEFIKSMASLMEKHKAKWEADGDRK